MSIRKVSFVQGEFYHIYNRGNSKQKIFHDKEDYFRFMGLLYVCNQESNFKSDNLGKNQGLLSIEINPSTQLVAIGAYCLMPNHFHIMTSQLKEDGVSRFMQKVSTAYVMYYNKKYERSGALFEGKFKSQYLSTDRHLKYLFSYIHLNPVKLIDKNWKENGIRNKIKVFNFLSTYTFSSYLDFMGARRLENKILKRSIFPKYFSNSQSLKREMFDWLSFQDNPLR